MRGLNDQICGLRIGRLALCSGWLDALVGFLDEGLGCRLLLLEEFLEMVDFKHRKRRVERSCPESARWRLAQWSHGAGSRSVMSIRSIVGSAVVGGSGLCVLTDASMAASRDSDDRSWSRMSRSMSS